MTREDIIGYYNSNCDAYAQETLNLDLRMQYNSFLRFLPSKAKILDAGCGAGRDAKAFIDMGHTVVAFDGAEKMVKLASAFAGIDVHHAFYENVYFPMRFHGIWACASFVHLTPDELKNVLFRLEGLLRFEGYLFMSLKYGKGVYESSGRVFYRYTLDTIASVITKPLVFEFVDSSVSNDGRVGHDGEKWLNVILRKGEGEKKGI